MLAIDVLNIEHLLGVQILVQFQILIVHMAVLKMQEPVGSVIGPCRYYISNTYPIR